MSTQREIKFRAWDNFNNRMISMPTLALDEENNTYMVDKGGGKFRDQNQLILMQFTGLQDEKGNDIYEGDIRKAIYFVQDQETIRFNQMRWSNENSCFYWDGPLIPEFIRVEVVGNIYENPELLG